MDSRRLTFPAKGRKSSTAQNKGCMKNISGMHVKVRQRVITLNLEGSRVIRIS
jgi:hypothetical protein